MCHDIDKFKCHCGRTQSTVSIQLAKLDSWEILKSRRNGKRIFYSIKDKNVVKVLQSLGVG
ncbi:MAG TPA: transcriptional regulator [Candidatus Altiarchaeales archaeon]|nr:transcriptional regulator [Candidatus Altiarchaeales archaeon]